jgi:hypothetical protein
MTLRSRGTTAATELDAGGWEAPVQTRPRFPSDRWVLLLGLVCFADIMVATSQIAWSAAGLLLGAVGGLTALLSAGLRLVTAFDWKSGRLRATAGALVGLVLATMAAVLPFSEVPTRIAFALSRPAFDQAGQEELSGGDVKPGLFGLIDIDRVRVTAPGIVDFEVVDSTGNRLGSLVYAPHVSGVFGWDLGQGWWLPTHHGFK